MRRTFTYLKGRPHAPARPAVGGAVARWEALPTDAGGEFDQEVSIDAGRLEPYVTWGTNPGQSVPVDRQRAESGNGDGRRAGAGLHGARAGNEDRGDRDRPRLHRLLHERPPRGPPPGSHRDPAAKPSIRRFGRWSCRGLSASKQQAEAEGLDAVFRQAGFVVARCRMFDVPRLNPDILGRGALAASTSNRNFEGRQGSGGRTHLVSPPMAPRRRSPATWSTSGNSRGTDGTVHSPSPAFSPRSPGERRHRPESSPSSS